MAEIQTKALEQFQNWVASEAGYRFCIQVAGSVFRDSFRYSSLASVFPYALHDSVSQEAKQDMQDDIAHDFILFLLDKFTDEIKKRQSLVLDLLSGRVHHVIQYGWHTFLSQWKEKVRNKEHNPRGYLYRRVREIVGKDERFATRKQQGRWITYTAAKKASVSNKIWTGADIAYRDWEAVGMEQSASPEKEIFLTRFLVPAAQDFHAQAVKALQEECWIPVREFIRFLSVQYPWLNRPVENVLPDANKLSGTMEAGRVNEDMEEWLDQFSQLASISCLAGQMTSCFTEEECRVFYLKLNQPSLTFREIGEQFSYPDHNRAYQLYTRAKTKVKRFSSNWPGPPLDELSKKVQSSLMDNIQSECKKRLNCP